MAEHSFRLNENEINNALFNMIISQEVFADNIDGLYDSLVERAKTDGGLAGDTKTYYSTDIIGTHKWNNDEEAANLLELERNKKVDIDKIVLDQFLQIRCSVDDYLSKRAFGSEGVFTSYNAVLLQWMRDTRKVSDSTRYNAFIGTYKSSVEGTKQKQTVKLPVVPESDFAQMEAASRIRAKLIAKKIEDILVDARDATRDYNDNKFMRSYSNKSFTVIFNADYANEMLYVDANTIFHDNVSSKISKEKLPGKYFGDVVVGGEDPTSCDFLTVDTSAHLATVKEGQTDLRAMDEMDVEIPGKEEPEHLFGGMAIPGGYVIHLTDDNKIPEDYKGLVYIVNKKKICVIVKDLPKFMSAFSVETSFWNPRALVTTHFLTYGFNTLKNLRNNPFIVLSEVNA